MSLMSLSAPIGIVAIFYITILCVNGETLTPEGQTAL